ncbi:MAG: DUF5689 domain-containing protein, partial [Sediminibacterium sp.]
MKYLINILLIIVLSAPLNSCNKNTYKNYPGGVPNDIISILDVRPIYKGKDVTLTKETLEGGSRLCAVVVSDHKEKNLIAGLLVVQDNRRLQTLRGISIEIASAANYQPGDSLNISLSQGTLTRKNGILTITGLADSDIKM